MTRRVIAINGKSILTKEKVYSVNDGRMIEVYFVYRVEFDNRGRVRHVPLTTEDNPNCNVDIRGIGGMGIRSLRKAKVVHLLNSI